MAARRLVVFFGAPGVGKGTFAKIVCSKKGWKHFSLGDALRDQVAKRTELGLRVEEFMKAGRLVPDELANAITLDYLVQHDKASGILLDGYPRTVGQAEKLLSSTKPSTILALNIKLEQRVCVEKLLAREECTTCGRGFNSAHIVNDGYEMPALRPDPKTCPLGPTKCNPVLTTRNDDTKETIERRFQEFHERTSPVLDVLSKSGVLREFSVKRGVADADALLAEIDR